MRKMFLLASAGLFATTAHAQADRTSPVPTTSHFVTADDYPAMSIRLQEQGTVGVRFTIEADGNVSECAVMTSSGKPLLDDAACVMVKKRWKFMPATENGLPIAIPMIANVVFKLR